MQGIVGLECRAMSGPEQPTPQFPSAGASGYEGAPATEGNARNATVSLVMGILGLVICPLVCSPLAIVFGRRAQDEIRTRPGVGGAGMAKAGVILGWVGLALFVLGVIIYAIIIASA